MTALEYRSDEMMAVAGAREIADGKVCLIGIGLPARAAILAKKLHAPNAVLVYESGVLDTDPSRAPLSIGDDDLAENSRSIVSLAEMFNYWLQGGRIDIGFLGAAQIDKFANLNTTVVGDYDHPKVRLPGSGGAPEIASFAGETIVVCRHSLRTFVDQLDFVTTVGHLDGTTDRRSLGFTGSGPSRVITDLGVLAIDPVSKELVLGGVYPGVSVDQVKAQTGWDLRISQDLGEIEPPSWTELKVLREISTNGSQK